MLCRWFYLVWQILKDWTSVVFPVLDHRVFVGLLCTGWIPFITRGVQIVSDSILHINDLEHLGMHLFDYMEFSVLSYVTPHSSCAWSSSMFNSNTETCWLLYSSRCFWELLIKSMYSECTVRNWILFSANNLCINTTEVRYAPQEMGQKKALNYA